MTVNRQLPSIPGTITVDGTGSTALTLPPDAAAGTYTFNVTTDSAQLDLGTPVGNAVTVTPSMNVVTTLGGNTVTAVFPDQVTVTGPAGWDGSLKLPEIKSSTAADLGGGTAGRIVEIGLSGSALTFDPPVQIILPGMSGKSVCWRRGGAIQSITRALSSDSAASLGANQDGYYNRGDGVSQSGPGTSRNSSPTRPTWSPQNPPRTAVEAEGAVAAEEPT